jgi:succinate dehydrogenase/fumarate reductase flavoprotein subunit
MQPAKRNNLDDMTMSRATDVLVIGGGPAGAWAAIAAAAEGRSVVLVDKGFLGTSGATAPSNTGTWCVPPGPGRAEAAQKRAARAGGLADPEHGERVLATAYAGLLQLQAQGYGFPRLEDGTPYLANLRGPDYMRFMRREVKGAGVTVLDHHPALGLLADAHGVGGATGIDRQRNLPWRITASAVVLAAGGCAFGERMLGATGLTGDGYLLAAEAGARLSGMEFSAQYGVAPAHTSLNKGLIYRWARFFDADGRVLDVQGDRHAAIAKAMRSGPVFASLDKADADIQAWLRHGQPNCFLPFDRQGIDPFSDRFEVTLRCEGTVRGIGGVRLRDEHGATDVPGLYAAGDTASRELLTGAISGGGGPNASWAIASGQWAGRGAARHAGALGRKANARSFAVAADTAASKGPDSAEIVAAVRAHMLPPDRHFYRNAASLAEASATFDELWQADAPASGDAQTLLRQREARALLATSRWSVASAQLRRESRGIHRRADATESTPDGERRIQSSGLGQAHAAWSTSQRQREAA